MTENIFVQPRQDEHPLAAPPARRFGKPRKIPDGQHEAGRAIAQAKRGLPRGDHDGAMAFDGGAPATRSGIDPDEGDQPLARRF